MKSLKIKLPFFSILIMLVTFSVTAQVKEYKVAPFQKVIVSPYIEVVFKQGDTEKVTVDAGYLPLEKFHAEVSDKTLQVYLDEAKWIPKNKKVKHKEWTTKQAVYKGTQVRITITYKNMEVVSVRGNESIKFESPFKQKKFTLRTYGESKIYLKNVDLDFLKATSYGESYVVVEQGQIEKQKFTTYGESVINAENIENLETEVTAYGESTLKLKVIDRLKITAFGDANITYYGTPEVSRGIVIGDATITGLN